MGNIRRCIRIRLLAWIELHSGLQWLLDDTLYKGKGVCGAPHARMRPHARAQQVELGTNPHDQGAAAHGREWIKIPFARRAVDPKLQRRCGNIGFETNIQATNRCTHVQTSRDGAWRRQRGRQEGRKDGRKPVTLQWWRKFVVAKINPSNEKPQVFKGPARWINSKLV